MSAEGTDTDPAAGTQIASDVALVWYYLRPGVGAQFDRERVIAAVSESGLELGTLRSTTGLVDFRKTCEELQVSYGEAGEFTVVAAKGRGSADFEAYDLVRAQDRVKLGEVKFFQHRRGSTGRVPDSERIKTIVRRAVADGVRALDVAATEEWVRVFSAEYAQTRVSIDMRDVRRLINDAFALYAVPIWHRYTTYFAYTDDLEELERVHRLVAGLGPVTWAVFPIADGADLSLLAESADRHLLREIEAVDNAIEQSRPATVRGASQADQRRRQKLADLAKRVARHERRLSLDLPLSRSALLHTTQKIDRLADTRRLPSVTPR